MATTKNIQSVERAFSILELFLSPSAAELSLKEISDALDLNKSTTFGLVNTLTNLGYLQQNLDNQKYALGLKMLSFSNVVESKNLIIQAAHPFLEKLNRQYGETVHCAIEHHGSVLYIDKVIASNMAIYINTQVGASNDLHCTGVGKCILAYMPKDQQERCLQKPLKTLTFNTITNVEQLRIELKKIKENGYAEDHEENMIGLHCVSVPVFSSENTVACAISVSSIAARINLAKENGLVRDMKHIASMISKHAFGYECPASNCNDQTE